MVDEIVIRPATPADIPDIVRLRRIMFKSMGYDDPAGLDASDAATAAYLTKSMPAGEFYGWLAVSPSGETVGAGGAVIDQHPPSPLNLSGQVGYIMNVVTTPRYRRQGIARRLMQTILQWMAEQGIEHTALHATEPGRPLYLEMGFADSNEMRRNPPETDSHTA